MENAYRNGTLYASYTAAAYAHLYELADQYGVNMEGAVSWSFEFENQPWFAGFRELATHGVDKPVLNVFRMLGRMRGPRVQVLNPTALRVADIRAQAQSRQPDIHALASADGHSLSVLVWNYHNDNLPAPATDVILSLQGLPAGAKRATMHHYRIDELHSNAYAA